MAAIDLTFSSPEPEERPRVPIRQSQLPTNFKREHRPYSNMHNSGDPSKWLGSVPGNGFKKPTRPINPEHLRHIISTSESNVIRQVLFDLCQISPALSGAVARGLAPYSSFAKDVVRDRYTSTQRPAPLASQAIKTERRTTVKPEQTAFDTMSSLDPRRPPTHMRDNGQHYASQANRPSRAAQETKREDLSSSDSEIRLPSSISRSVQRASTRPISLHQQTRASSAATPTSRPEPSPSSAAAPRIISVKREPQTKPKVKMCVQCNTEYENDTDGCLWHPGDIVKNRDGELVYSCCNESSDATGCNFALHTDGSEEETSSSERKRPSPDPHSHGPSQKRPRQLRY